MESQRDWNVTIKRISILCIVSIILAMGVAVFFTGRLWDIANIKINLLNLRIWTTFNRAYIVYFVFMFCGLHLIVPVKKLYNWIFDKRWLLGIVLLIFLTINRYHGDSIGYYTNAIQPGSGTEASYPIFGETRPIRSDEFVATTPSVLASSYGETPYTKYNNIMRGDATLNIVNGVYLSYATLGYAPQELVYAVLPVEYAFSFCWWFPLILGFLMSTELFYIITNKKKLLSTTGAFLIVFSSFFLWWGFSIYYTVAPGVIVCLHYFLQSKEKWKKVLFGVGTAICFSVFVTNLYPAWQVPLGYMFLAIGIWLLHDNWDKIKRLKKDEWIILGGAVLFMVSLIVSYLLSISEYMGTIAQTAYPGERVDTGSFYWSKLFYGAQSLFYAYKDIGNPSEAGTFFSLFPIPTIAAAYCWIKEKKKDWLTGGLLLVQIPMLIYITTGFPEIIAKVLLFSNSTTYRTIDIIGLMQIYFLVIILSRYENVKKMPLLVAIPFGILVAFMNIFVSTRDFPEYMNLYQNIIMFLIIAALCIGIMVSLKEKMKYVLMVTLIIISIFTGSYVRPVMKGLDAIYSKPVASKIQEICEQDPEAKWLTSGGGIVLSAYSVACGASTINSVNTYPNLELWEKLDTDSKYEEIYNRYAHVNVVFTNEETSFELIQADFMQVNLSYKDVEKIDAKYLLTLEALNVDTNNQYVEFEKIYEENGSSIYQIIYLQ